MMGGKESPARLLIRHFVRRFIDNDLLSAHVDRHEGLGFFAALLIAGGVFAGFILAQKYIFFVPSASWVAVTAIEDRFVILAVSMIVVALATAAQWDTLSLDARDTAILGPLPMRTGDIVAAKAAANGVFAVLLVAAVAVGPSAMHAIVLLSSVPVDLLEALRVLAASVLAAVMASTLAFVAVVVLREWLRLVVGARIFARVSGVVQATLIVALTTLLALAVFEPPGVTRTWLWWDARAPVSPFAVPVVWFLGVAEALNGDAIVFAPLTGVVVDDDLSRMYVSNRPLFRALALTGSIGLVASVVLGAAAYAWNSRRLPHAPPGRSPARRPVRGWLAALARWSIVRDPVAQAGFFFTLQVLLRSAPHRLAMAVGAAVALAVAIVIVGSAPPPDLFPVPLSIWALQSMVLIALLAAFRHVTAVPAELRANWIFHQCWPGRLRPYLAGVERAALVAVVVPALLALVPVHAFFLGASAALFHAMSGALLADVLLAVIFTREEMPPFVSSYAPRGNIRKLGPVYAMAALAFAFSTAAVERAASASALGMFVHSIGLFALFAIVRAAASMRRGGRPMALSPDVPEATAQTLGLSG
jgi:hypothetical protein